MAGPVEAGGARPDVMSRRGLLRAAAYLGGGALAGSLLAACGNQSGSSSSGGSSVATSNALTQQSQGIAPTSSSSAGSSSAAVSSSMSTSASSMASSSGTMSASTSMSGSASSSMSSSASMSTASSLSSGSANSAMTSSAMSSSGSAAGSSSAAVGMAGATYVAHKDVSGNITFWHFWSSPVRHNAIRRIINSFQGEYPGIKVTDTAYPFGDIWTKNLAAVAANSGMPDVIVSDRPSLRFTAKNNVYQSLDTLAKQDNVTGAPFWPFTWTEANLDGKPYGLPYETDIRVLYYNKAALADGGLNPDQPPQDWPALTAAADKVDVKTNGKLTRATFWPTYGNIGLDTWAWNNGGEWQDQNNNPTVNAKPNVDALAWMKTWFDRYGDSNWKAFQATFGQGNQDGFMSGKVAMDVDIGGYISFLNFYNPSFKTKDGKNLGWDIAAIPPNTGHKPASFSGGFSLSIDRGVKNLAPAWEFIKYAVFVGQASWARDTYSMPTVEAIAKNDPELNGDPHWKFLVDAMSYGRPGVYNPYTDNLLKGLGDAVNNVEAGKQTPQAALDQAQQVALQQVQLGKARGQ